MRELAWQFAVSPDEVQVWIANPGTHHTSISYRDLMNPSQEWREITVVTREFLRRIVDESTSMVLGPMLVVDGRNKTELEGAIDGAVRSGMLLVRR